MTAAPIIARLAAAGLLALIANASIALSGGEGLMRGATAAAEAPTAICRHFMIF